MVVAHASIPASGQITLHASRASSWVMSAPRMRNGSRPGTITRQDMRFTAANQKRGR